MAPLARACCCFAVDRRHARPASPLSLPFYCRRHQRACLVALTEDYPCPRASSPALTPCAHSRPTRPTPPLAVSTPASTCAPASPRPRSPGHDALPHTPESCPCSSLLPAASATHAPRRYPLLSMLLSSRYPLRLTAPTTARLAPDRASRWPPCRPAPPRSCICYCCCRSWPCLQPPPPALAVVARCSLPASSPKLTDLAAAPGRLPRRRWPRPAPGHSAPRARAPTPNNPPWLAPVPLTKGPRPCLDKKRNVKKYINKNN
nr:vegetative cell wall protein gp1-like [Aegilops tauschii subsp. strangulata]